MALFTRGGPLLRGAALAGAGALGYRLGRRTRNRTERQLAEVGESTFTVAETFAVAETFVVAELERLTRLLDQGALNQSEFDAAKRELLDGV